MALWIFGDSFSVGAGLVSPIYLNDSSEFLLEQPEDKMFFGDLIGDYFSIPPSEQFNRAVGGLSSPEIFLVVLAHISKFRKGDFIVVGTSFPQREPFIMGELTKEKIVNNTVKAFRGNSYFDCTNGYPSLSSLDKVNKRYKDAIAPITFKQAWEQASLYSEIVKYPNSTYYSKWYNLHFTILLDFLAKEIGIKYVLWEVSREWKKYETIEQATKSKIEDYHWSWDGSHKFGESVIGRFIEKYT